MALGKYATAWVVCSMMMGCSMVDPPLAAGGAYSDHDEQSDFDPAPALSGKGDDIAPVFDEDHIVSDAFFLDSAGMTADEIQTFLDDTPYGNQSWLATETVGTQRVADLIAAAAVRHNIHPMMILTRFQVEGSHIAKSRHPGSRAANRALGCGCFDGRECQNQFLGIDNQIDCAADTLEKRFQGSVDGSWEWQRGVSNRSLDGVRVTPSNHATAALYAYTPWVLRGRGGNWLVWNVTKKFLAHVPEAGHVGTTSPGTTSGPVWIGSPCQTDDDCGFVHGEDFGFCYDFVDIDTGATHGFCSLVCEGFCPDNPDAPTTFCIEADVGGVGICASKSEATNNFCADVPGTVPVDVERFIGASTAPAGAATVCAANDGLE